MNETEIVKYRGKVIAMVIRSKVRVDGVHFFTTINHPMQVAAHNYNNTRETNLHKTNLRKPVKISEFHKFLYITKGKVSVILINNKEVTIAKKVLNKGDGIIIMNTFHKAYFSKGSKAFEIKQGPYAPDT
jgi:hypothetical protein